MQSNVRPLVNHWRAQANGAIKRLFSFSKVTVASPLQMRLFAKLY